MDLQSSPTKRFKAFGDFSPAEVACWQTLMERGDTLSLPMRADLRSESGSSSGVFLLKSGWVSAGTLLSNGVEQMFKIHLPGDVLGAPSLAFKEPVELLSALTPVLITLISKSEVQRVFSECPSLAYRLFLGSQEERMFLMDRLAIGGQLSARQAVAAFLVDLHDRMCSADLVEGTRISIPLNQKQIGQVLGLSEVHVNRVLKDLAGGGLISKSRQTYDLIDVSRLRRFGEIPARALAQVDPCAFVPSPPPMTEVRR